MTEHLILRTFVHDFHTKLGHNCLVGVIYLTLKAACFCFCSGDRNRRVVLHNKHYIHLTGFTSLIRCNPPPLHTPGWPAHFFLFLMVLSAFALPHKLLHNALKEFLFNLKHHYHFSYSSVLPFKDIYMHFFSPFSLHGRNWADKHTTIH